MKKHINQRGYALLIVLLTIIIFLSLSSVFISASLNHATQEKTTDQINQAYVAAEMGVKYFETTFSNSYEEIQIDLTSYSNNLVSSLYNSESFKNMSISNQEKELLITRELIAEELKRLLEPKFNESLSNYQKEIGSNISYELLKEDSNPIVLKKLNSLTILFTQKIIGINKESEKILDFDISISIPELKLRKEIINPNANEGWKIFKPDFVNHIPPFPSNTSECSDVSTFKNTSCNWVGDKNDNKNNPLDFENSRIYVPSINMTQPIEIKNNNNTNFKNSNFYVKQNIDFKNMNSSDNINIFASASIDLKNLTNTNNMYLINKGSTTFHNLRAENSEFYIHGTLSAHKFEVSNTILYLNGAIHTSNGFSLENKSIACLYGSMNIGSYNIDATSDLYYYGSLAGTAKGKSAISLNYVDFQKKCNSTVIESPVKVTIENSWEEPIIKVEY